MTQESVEKKQKLVQSEQNGWLPPSVKEMKDPFQFASATHHSKIPERIAESPNEPVYLGVDEAGRGPVLGPMVYGIAYCLEKYSKELKKFGFADSKTLKEEKRTELFQIMDQEEHELNVNVGWATRTMTARDISSGMLQPSHGKGSYNLNEQAHDATIQLVREVIQSGVNVKYLYVDTVGPPTTYQAKLQREFPGINVTVAKKADSIYPIVSTASVVAKVTRDMNLQYYVDNLATIDDGRKLGSGYPSDPNTSKWLNGMVDPVFGWNFGLVRFSWQTAKDSLVRNGAVDVIYEHDCVKNDAGYVEIDSFFTEKADKIGRDFYGKSVTL
ncbi:ribonuclease H2 subunit A [[Candida] anglica]|uniref:Ribonuclease n=1 Tax=[Candida] anglica TaxID=148631 RepID=A0ABP0EB31_9ASCO